MTILFIYFIGGVRHGFIKAGVPTILAVIVAVFATIVVLASRDQFIAASLLTLLLVLPMLASHRHRATAISVTVFMGLLVVASSQLGNIVGNYLEYNPSAVFQNRLSRSLESPASTDGLLRPIRQLDAALARWSASPIVGSGFDIRGKPFATYSHHNDLLNILTSTGLIGVLILTILVFLLSRLDLILLVPFLFPGLTNSFILAPSNLLLFMLVAGMIYRRRRNHSPVETEAVFAANDLPAGRQHSYAG
jgi:hypothetical protein